MTDLKNIMQKMDIAGLCTRERTNTERKFYKLKNLNNFCFFTQICNHGLSRYSLTWTTFVRKPYCALLLREIRDNPTMTVSVCLEHLVYICMVTKTGGEDFEKIQPFSSITVRRETFQKFTVFVWMTLQKLKTSCSSTYSYMKLIL